MRMTASIVQALIRWCELKKESLRSAGISVECVASSDTPSSSARVDLETADALWRVTVWDHNGMCDLERLNFSSGELHCRHQEHLDAAQVASLMDDLALRVRER